MKTEYTETSVYSLIREGEMSTRDYDIVALNREETTLLEGILTYDYSQIKPFSAAYLVRISGGTQKSGALRPGGAGAQ